MKPENWLKAHDAAACLGLSELNLLYRRRMGQEPPHIKTRTGLIYYELEAIRTWAAENATTLSIWKTLAQRGKRKGEAMDKATHNKTTVEVVRRTELHQIRVAHTMGRACHAHSGWFGDLRAAVADFRAALAEEEKRALRILQEIADAREALAKMEAGDGSAEA